MALGSLRRRASLSAGPFPPGRRSRAAVWRWVVGLLLAIGVIAVVIAAAGGLADAERALRRTELSWVAFAVAVEALSYLLMGLHLRRLARPSAAVSRRLGVGLALVISGFGLLTPAAPAEGLAIAARQLRQRGFDQRQATLTLGFSEWFAMRVFVLVATVDVMVAVAVDDLPVADFVPLLAVASVGFALLVLSARLARRRSSGERAAVVLGWLRFWRPRPPVSERKAAGAAWHRQAMAIVGSPPNRLLLVALAASALLADMGCLWLSLVAARVQVSVVVVVLAAVAGVLASAVPFLPGGLGVVEAVMPAVLHHFGAPLDASLAGALIYRVVGTLLPAAVGVVVVIGLTLAGRIGPSGDDRASLGAE